MLVDNNYTMTDKLETVPEDVELDFDSPENADTRALMLNIFIKYHQRWYKQSSNTGFLTGTDAMKKNSTSHMMESFYTELLKFKAAKKELTSVYEPGSVSKEEKDKFDELYLLTIDDKLTHFSPRMLSLIHHLAVKHTDDWSTIDWDIIPAKRNLK